MVQPALSSVKTESGAREIVFRRVLASAIGAVEGAGVPYLLIGGVGSATLGRPRWTEDIDILVAPVDADRTLDSLAQEGFDTERTNEHWIFKATMGDIVVDIIFRLVGDIYLDDDMVKHGVPASFGDVRVLVAAPEDQIVVKAIANDEASSRHWNDALALIAVCDIDWDYLVRRAVRGPRRVLSLLIYAQSSDLVVPSSAIDALYRQIYGGKE